ncbi:MAG: Nicotinate-nucleotide pyrophosphorylase, partial [Pseudomonadota bacterium]
MGVSVANCLALFFYLIWEESLSGLMDTIMLSSELISEAVRLNVEAALAEDVGDGDISAQLIPAVKEAQARIISREPAVVCGQAWAEAVFRRLDPNVQIEWQVPEGELVSANQSIVVLTGNARGLLTAERSAM